VVVERRVEFGKRKPTVPRAIGLPDEERGEVIGRPLANRDVVFSEAERDHPPQLRAIDLAVAVEVVDSKRKTSLVASAAVEDALHGGEERVRADAVVGVAAEGGHEAPSEVFAPNAQAARDRRSVQPPIGTPRIAKGGLERLEELLVQRVQAVDGAVSTACRGAR
jgi:hypothetical protein